MSNLLILLIAFLQINGSLCESNGYVPTWGIVVLALVGAVLLMMFVAFALMLAFRRRQ